MNFSQITADLSRPFAGSESWNGELDVTGVPAPMDIFYRMSWSDFQTFTMGKGQYTFAKLQGYIQTCISKNMKLNFSIMAMCDFCSPAGVWNGVNSFLPKYIQDGMKGQIIKNNFAYQNWNDAFYLQEYLAINQAVYAWLSANNYLKYIGYVDCAGYGNSGEWTTNDAVIGTPAEPTDTNKMKIIDAVVQSFPDVQCNALIAMFDGNVQLGNTKNSSAVGYYALTTKNKKGLLGWKRESWGESNSQAWWNDRWSTGNTTVYNGFDFGNAIRTRYLQAPVVGELMNFVDGTHYNDLDSQISAAHNTSIGNGNMESNQGDSVCQQNARNAYAKMGAKWTLTAGTVLKNVLTLSFSNKGLCPIYENFVIKYYLKRSGLPTYTVVSKDLRLITSDFADVQDFSNLPTGTYDLYVSIEDPTGVRQPYPLAIQGRLIDGSYLLQSGLLLTGGGIIPPPNPGQDLSAFTTQVPASGTDNDYPAWTNIKGIQCGMKFISSVAGFIKGIKFYKTAGNDGAHVAQLYDATGKLLVSTPFGAETATGWQTVLFPTPVAVLAGATYIASYFSPNGNYTETNDFLKTADLVNGTLKIPKDGTGGASGKDPGTGNGLYVYTATPAFPNQLFASQNNWVDVIFNTSGGITPPPNQPPVVIITGPTDLKLVAGSIILDGSGSTDDGTISSYAWSLVSGPVGAVIAAPLSAKTNINGLVPGTYVFALKVTDNLGLFTTKNYTTTVHF